MTIDRIYDEAAEWQVRSQDEAMDWDGFTAWLEADPRHRTAYDELALIDAKFDEHAAGLLNAVPDVVPTPANDPQPTRWSRWAGFGGAAVAAGLALVLAFQPFAGETAAREYRTAPGQTREVALDAGGHIVLAPASHLTVRGEQIALQGAGYFNVPHKADRTLVIRAGDIEVTDIGTRFSIDDEIDSASVEVAEGTLSVRSPRLAKPITLSGGQALRLDRSHGVVRILSVDPQRVASWRSGKLQFDQVGLALVARDISRYSGETVTVDPAIARQPFSGVIAISHGEAPARTLAQILSLDVKKVDGTIRLEPRRR